MVPACVIVKRVLFRDFLEVIASKLRDIFILVDVDVDVDVDG